MQGIQILNPKEGYNLIAPFYDSWKWQEFWRRNEQPYIMRWSKHLLPGTGADLGAGSGNNIRLFINSGHNIVAYDISDMMLMACQHKYAKEIESGRLRCIIQDISKINVSTRQYDWLLCNRVLSHIMDVSNVIKRMAHILKVNGECFISDVHPLHSYEHTHYRIGSKDVIIETYKHDLNEMTNMFYYNNFEIVDFKEICKTELFDKDIAENINTIQENIPIFYYYVLRKK